MPVASPVEGSLAQSADKPTKSPTNVHDVNNLYVTQESDLFESFYFSEKAPGEIPDAQVGSTDSFKML